MHLLVLVLSCLPLFSGFLHFAAFARDSLHSPDGYASLSFDSCYLYGDSVALAFSRSTIETESPMTEAPWRLTSVACAVGQTVVHSRHLEISDAPDCSDLLTRTAALRDSLASAVVHSCMQPLAGASRLVANYLAMNFASPAPVLDGTPESVLAFAFVYSHNLHRKPSAPALGSWSTNARDVCRIHDERNVIYIQPPTHANKFFSEIQCGRSSGRVFEFHALSSSLTCEQVASLFSIALVCATIADLHQIAQSRMPAPSDSIATRRQECGLEGLGNEIVFQRRVNSSRWKIKEISCSTAQRQLSGQHIARLEHRLDKIFAQPARMKELRKFVGFARLRLFDQPPHFCHALRLDLGSSVSFNNLCT